MIIIRIWGGLGNQMFQYAFGYAMAKERRTTLKLDTYFFSEKYQSNNSYTNQRLQITDMTIEFKEQVNSVGEVRSAAFLQKQFVNRVCKVFPSFVLNLKGMKYVKETRLTYLPKMVTMKGENLYFDGYWQTEKYFSKYKKELKEQFTITSTTADAYANKIGILNQNAVAVHMRLGDYVKKSIVSNYNQIIAPQYYLNAMKDILKINPDAKFYVFSNDPKKAKKILDDKVNFELVNDDRTLSDMEEFKVMSACANHIVSNSTFSWWAAWLNDGNGKTFAPDIFFGNRYIIPDSWIKVSIE